ncbi:MAG: glycine cleavage system aminomethyltransferase GcvT [Chloroherpetonaceae bacterium]|nr:glycine cleavage system aminomethyltransferase GcvT [Chthonomonadaceae bacterium]MDW8208763.1 glycine cleavage system aminomethyltransferase GcvT [Chloroherpetonaceae bacterium]
MAVSDLKRTPLYDVHLAAGARMVPFAGWAMPVSYQSILDEARVVRQHAGIFDISHMGRVCVEGAESLPVLQRVTSNDVSRLAPGDAQYSLFLTPQGGIIDDIIVYRRRAQEFLLVVNASNTEEDLRWIREHTAQSVAVVDRTSETAMVAVQGPHAPSLVAGVLESPALLDLGRFQFAEVEFRGTLIVCCRTGYTGEDGFELIGPVQEVSSLWERCIRAGAVPCGLGARDTLRIEAGYPLYGHEIDTHTSPVEAGLMWVVKLEKGEFIGRDAVMQIRSEGVLRRLVGMLLDSRIQPRQGYTVHAGDAVVGSVTSGTFSPLRHCGIAMGYVATPLARPGTRVEIDIRGKRVPARIVPKKNLLAPYPEHSEG